MCKIYLCSRRHAICFDRNMQLHYGRGLRESKCKEYLPEMAYAKTHSVLF